MFDCCSLVEENKPKEQSMLLTGSPTPSVSPALFCRQMLGVAKVESLSKSVTILAPLLVCVEVASVLKVDGICI